MVRPRHAQGVTGRRVRAQQRAEDEAEDVHEDVHTHDYADLHVHDDAPAAYDVLVVRLVSC